jgi:hypothetical protein
MDGWCGGEQAARQRAEWRWVCWIICPLGVLLWGPQASKAALLVRNRILEVRESLTDLFDEKKTRRMGGVVVSRRLDREVSGIWLGKNLSVGCGFWHPQASVVVSHG